MTCNNAAGLRSEPRCIGDYSASQTPSCISGGLLRGREGNGREWREEEGRVRENEERSIPYCYNPCTPGAEQNLV